MIKPLASDTCSYHTIKLAKITLTVQRTKFFMATKSEEHWFIQLLSHTLVLHLPLIAESEAYCCY
jgi:hypothetical protein